MFDYEYALSKAQNACKAAFYNTDVTLVKIEISGGYTQTQTVETLDIITADVQPYSGKLAAEEYGLSEECQLKMYSDYNEYINEGIYAEIAGQRYRIEYAEQWGVGIVSILKVVDMDD